MPYVSRNAELKTQGYNSKGGRSKYKPHYGKKEQGRWAGKRLS